MLGRKKHLNHTTLVLFGNLSSIKDSNLLPSTKENGNKNTKITPNLPAKYVNWAQCPGTPWAPILHRLHHCTEERCIGMVGNTVLLVRGALQSPKPEIWGEYVLGAKLWRWRCAKRFRRKPLATFWQTSWKSSMSTWPSNGWQISSQTSTWHQHLFSVIPNPNWWILLGALHLWWRQAGRFEVSPAFLALGILVHLAWE